MKIRPQTFIAGLTGTASPMNNIGAKGFYIQSVGRRWWIRKSGAILANLPYTIESPHLGQVEVRVEFGKIASQTAGRPLEERLKVIGAHMKELADSGKLAPDKMNPALYPSKRSYHTLEQLEAMQEKMKKKAREQGERTAMRAVARVF